MADIGFHLALLNLMELVGKQRTIADQNTGRNLLFYGCDVSEEQDSVSWSKRGADKGGFSACNHSPPISHSRICFASRPHSLLMDAENDNNYSIVM